MLDELAHRTVGTTGHNRDNWLTLRSATQWRRACFNARYAAPSFDCRMTQMGREHLSTHGIVTAETGRSFRGCQISAPNASVTGRAQSRRSPSRQHRAYGIPKGNPGSAAAPQEDWTASPLDPPMSCRFRPLDARHRAMPFSPRDTDVDLTRPLPPHARLWLRIERIHDSSNFVDMVSRHDEFKRDPAAR